MAVQRILCKSNKLQWALSDGSGWDVYMTLSASAFDCALLSRERERQDYEYVRKKVRVQEIKQEYKSDC